MGSNTFAPYFKLWAPDGRSHSWHTALESDGYNRITLDVTHAVAGTFVAEVGSDLGSYATGNYDLRVASAAAFGQPAATIAGQNAELLAEGTAIAFP
jgi:hypothetical protein